MRGSMFIRLLVAGIFLAVASPVFAQTFNQFLVFGPSLLDSGYFKYSGGDAHFTAARANGGALTPSGGIMNTDILASRFGLTDVPVSAPGGGTNYAVSGARIDGPNPLPNTAGTPSIVQQMANYLASTGGVGNSNALYLLSAGSNDVGFARTTYGFQAPAYFAFLTDQANTFVNGVARLQSAGARYIVIPKLTGDFLNTSIYNGLSAAGVKFIPADQAAMIAAVKASPAGFGFTSVTPGTLPPVLSSPSACRPPAGGYSGYGLYCIPSTTPAPGVAYLGSANALQTSLYSDDLHLSPAGQKIQADYYYSLIVAPSQISFLTENAIQFRHGVTGGIQEQIDISQRKSAPGFNVWFNGDVSSLKLNNSSTGFPGDPSTPVSGTLGLNYRINNALIGGALTLGTHSPSFSSGGGFTEDEIALSVYGATRTGQVWANAILTYGRLSYDVNRIVPLGISFESNTGSTRGRNVSFAGLVGYDFVTGSVTHGPVVGVEVQSVGVNAFTESGSFTSLGFSNIGRNAVVSALGYRASMVWGIWKPFAQVTYNREFDGLDHEVTAILTSMVAPSYSLPMVSLGRDWASTTLGSTVDLGPDLTGLAAFTAQLGQAHTTSYGGRIGVNYAFNAPVSVEH
jgi:outer membrane lipase/esterase